MRRGRPRLRSCSCPSGSNLVRSITLHHRVLSLLTIGALAPIESSTMSRLWDRYTLTRQLSAWSFFWKLIPGAFDSEYHRRWRVEVTCVCDARAGRARIVAMLIWSTSNSVAVVRSQKISMIFFSVVSFLIRLVGLVLFFVQVRQTSFPIRQAPYITKVP